MKNKVLTCIVLTAIIIFVSVASVMAQYKTTFAGDVNINPSQTLEYGEPRVTVAFNGDVYVSRLVRPNGENMWAGYDLLKSTDGGQTFTELTTGQATPINTYYTALDILACGSNDADFKLVVSLARIDLGSGVAKIGMAWYNMAGTIGGGVLLDEATYTSNSSRGWESISLSSDTKSPASQSAPFSITIAASKASLFDSVVVWTGNDGGASFTRRSLAGTAGYIKNVSCATGTINGSTYPRAGIVWDEHLNEADEWGNVKAHFIWSDDGTDFNTSGPYDVAYTGNQQRTPVITMANDATLPDYHGCITYVHNGQDKDVRMVAFSLLVNGPPQIDPSFLDVAVADGPGDQVDPHTSYNPADNMFLFTYYNAGNDALVYKTTTLNSLILPPATAHLNYRDAQSAMTNPMPRVDGLTESRNFFVWADQFKTFIDLEIRWPVSVQQTSVAVSDVKLFPNPATDNVNISFSSENNDKVQLSVIDVSGRILQNTEATIIKGSNKIPLALNDLPTGNYTIRLSGEHTNTAVMFTVQH